MLDVKNRVVFIQINDRLVQYTADLVKRFMQTGSSDDHDEDPTIAADAHAGEVGQLGRYDPMVDEELDTFGRLVDDCWNRGNGRTEGAVNILTIKLIKYADEHAQQGDFKSSKTEEVNGIIKRQIWTQVS